MFGMSRIFGGVARRAGRPGGRLRGFIPAAVLLVFAAVPRPVEAAELVIGFIDSERIFAEYQRARDADAELRADVAKWNEEADARQRELEKLIEEYESQSLILSEPRRREFEEEIQRKRSDLDAFVREIWAPNGKVDQRKQQLSLPIIEKINEVVTRLGEERGFSIIFDAADANVVYADRALDLTDEILQELNAEN